MDRAELLRLADACEKAAAEYQNVHSMDKGKAWRCALILTVHGHLFGDVAPSLRALAGDDNG